MAMSSTKRAPLAVLRLCALLGCVVLAQPGLSRADTRTQPLDMQGETGITLSVQACAAVVEMYEGDAPMLAYDPALHAFAVQQADDGGIVVTLEGVAEEASLDIGKAAVLRLPPGLLDRVVVQAEGSDVMVQALEADLSVVATDTRISLQHPKGSTRSMALDLIESDCTLVLDAKAEDYRLDFALRNCQVTVPSGLPSYKGTGDYRYTDGEGTAVLGAQGRDSAIHVRFVLRQEN